MNDVRALHNGLVDAGVAHNYHESAGGHEWPVWQRELAKSLVFINAQL